MKVCVTLFTMLFVSLICSMTHAADPLVETVQKRYYLIRRIGPSVDRFFSLCTKHLKAAGLRKIILGSALRNQSFRNPEVCDIARAIVETGNVEPFYKLWNKLLAYQQLDNDTFAQETVTMLLMIYQQMINVLLGYKGHPIFEAHDEGIGQIDDHAKGILRGYHREANELLHGHHMIADIRKDSLGDLGSTTTVLVTVLNEKTSPVDLVRHNTMRFYYIQRMVNALFLLASQRAINSDMKALAQLTFFHPDIASCAQMMVGTNTLEPLFVLWKRFTMYELVADEQFVHEFIELVVLVYSYCVSTQEDQAGTEDRAGTVPVPLDPQVLHEQIAGMQIPELLMLLDDMVEQFDKVAQAYELNNPSLSWNEWFAKYWWAPPVILATFILTVAQHAQALGWISQNPPVSS